MVLILVIAGLVIERWRLLTRWWVWRTLIDVAPSVGGIEVRHSRWVPRLRGLWRDGCTVMVPASVIAATDEQLAGLARAVGRRVHRTCRYGGRVELRRRHFDVFEVR